MGKKYIATPRVYELHRFFEAKAELNPEKYFKATDIQKLLSDIYKWDETGVDKGKSFVGKIGRAINGDVQIHNNCGLFHKIIIGNRRHGYKMATKEEYEEWSRRRWIEAKSMIKRLAYLDGQHNLDGQCKLIFNKNSRARDYWQIFIKGISEEDIQPNEVQEPQPIKANKDDFKHGQMLLDLFPEDKPTAQVSH